MTSFVNGKLLIDGTWVDGCGGGVIEVVDPGSEELIGAVVAGTAADVGRAVEAAARSFGDGRWRDLPGARRGELLWRISELLDGRIDDLALLESRDNGMPLGAARGMVSMAARCFRYFAGWADKLHGHTSEIVAGGQRYLGYSLREPIGVVGMITPWNVPLAAASWKIAPMLAAGCSGVLKPAEDTPLSALSLGEIILEAGVPDGVVNIVTGIGETAGSALATHPEIDKLSFTGSTEVGREIVRASAGNLKKLTLELGGKSPVVVLADADPAIVVPAVAQAIFGNSGQICSAGSRLIVHEHLHDEVVGGIADVGRSLRPGYCTDPGVTLGPLVSATQLAAVTGYIEAGVQEGAEVASGGNRLDRAGYFVEPTVLTRTTPKMQVVREEIFGPVLSAMTFLDESEAICLANDSIYGLAASVFTQSVASAHGIARRLRAGRVGINVHAIHDYSMATGGYKQSGWGRENGAEGLDGYLETKSVFTSLGA